MPTLYRVEYTPPVPPAQAWTKASVTAVEVTDAEFAELGFGDKDICSVEWQEGPDLFVELWRHEEAAKTRAKPLLTQARLESIFQVVEKEAQLYQAENHQKPPV